MIQMILKNTESVELQEIRHLELLQQVMADLLLADGQQVKTAI